MFNILERVKNVVGTVLVLVSMVDWIGCGEGEISNCTTQEDSEIRGSCWCKVEPNPALIHSPYIILGGGLPKNSLVRIVVADGLGKASFETTASQAGQISMQHQSDALGQAIVRIYRPGKQKDFFLVSCAFEVINPNECGNNICEEGEDCINCKVDCMEGCSPVCGDLTCEGDETCQTCPADCKEGCSPVCGDQTCESDETCQTCPADCKEGCSPVCGDLTCEGDETCQTCPVDCKEGCAPVCGDTRCEGDETCITCMADCGLCPQPVGKGIWISPEEIQKLPESGAAWNNLKNIADGDLGSPDLTNQDNKHCVKTLAVALVYAKNLQNSYREKARVAIVSALGTERAGADNSILSLGRQLGAYVIAADLIDLKNYNPSDDQKFRIWLADIRTRELGGHGRWTQLVQCHENAAANWSAFAGASRIAASLYLGDMDDVARAAKIFEAWLGNRAAYPNDAPGQDGYFVPTSGGDLSWSCDPTNWIAVNPGCSKSGVDLNGALVEDIVRGGSFAWPPGDTGMSYSWEALQGTFVQAELLYRAGYDCYNWSNQALRRAMDFMVRAGWAMKSVGGYVPWIANYRYGTSYPTQTAGYGRVMGYTDWTHAN